MQGVIKVDKMDCAGYSTCFRHICLRRLDDHTDDLESCRWPLGVLKLFQTLKRSCGGLVRQERYLPYIYVAPRQTIGSNITPGHFTTKLDLGN